MASSDSDLTTVAAVAAYIGGIDGTDPPVNSLLQSLVTAASAFASRYVVLKRGASPRTITGRRRACFR